MPCETTVPPMRTGVEHSGSVGLVVDPVQPGLPRGNLFARTPEAGVRAELSGRSNRRVEGRAQPILFEEGLVQPLNSPLVKMIARVVQLGGRRAGKGEANLGVAGDGHAHLEIGDVDA